MTLGRALPGVLLLAGDDASSKHFFALFSTLMSVQLTDAAAACKAPVLTVPVN